mgnify:CR=1 FL=1
MNILTYAGCVTKDPDSGIHNVGVYRGMVSARDRIPVLIWRAQHWGGHLSKYEERGEEMPVAYVIGWEPSLGFTGGAPVPPKPTSKPRPMLTQEDFVAILAFAPAGPSDADVAALGNLLRGVGQPNLSSLAKRLEAGIGGFGGDSPDGRKLAAQMLQPLAQKSLAMFALQFVPERDDDWALEMRAKLFSKSFCPDSIWNAAKFAELELLPSVIGIVLSSSAG